MAISGIYKIQSRIKPERIYIGSAVNIRERWRIHRREFKKGKNSPKLQRHFNKYGESDLQYSVLLGCEKEDLIKTEQYFIDSYNPYFNICKIAGSSLGLKRSDKTRQLQRLIKLGTKQSLEHIEKSRLRMIGNTYNNGKKRKTPCSDETKRKLREAMLRIGRVPPSRKGTKWSEESKQRARHPHLKIAL
jgi:group I intron endonuclease